MLKKLKRYQFLFEELVKRDFKKKYKGAVLGIGWSLLSPLLMLLVMKLVFTQFFGRATPHYTIYLFAGNLVFSYFSEATKGGMTSLLENAKIFTKVDVPKYLFLFSKNVQTFIGFLLTLVLFFIFVAFDGLAFTWKFLLLLYPIVMLLLFNIGVGLILSALYVFFRDTKYLYDVFLRLLMYASAIFYNIDGYAYKAEALCESNEGESLDSALVPLADGRLLVVAEIPKSACLRTGEWTLSLQMGEQTWEYALER